MADPSKPRAAFAPWDRRELPGLFDVEETARRVGNYKWIEMKLFEALGGWVATVPELDVKMRLGTHCYHHAWHAELWHKRLPELREMNQDRLSVPPNDEMVAFVDAMTEPQAPELTIEKLVGADLLARDERFVRLTTQERFSDPRSPGTRSGGRGATRLTPARPDAPDAARNLMHGIFVGEVQALEGAGRTCWDFETGSGSD